MLKNFFENIRDLNLTNIINVKDYFTWVLTFLTSGLITKLLFFVKKVRIEGVDFDGLYTKQTEGNYINECVSEHFDGVKNRFLVNSEKKCVYAKTVIFKIREIEKFIFKNMVFKIYLDNDNQSINILQINNGSATFNGGELLFEVKSYKIDEEQVTIHRELIKLFEQKEGCVRLVKKLDLKAFSEEYSDILNNILYFSIKYNEDDSSLSIPVYFNSSEEKFFISGGIGAGGPAKITPEKMPLVEIKDLEDDLEKKFKIERYFNEGLSVLDLCILVNSPMKICYDIELWDINDKRLAKTSIKDFEIPFCYYNFFSPYMDEFEILFVNKNESFEFSYSDVKTKLNNLSIINSIERNKQQLLSI